MREYMRSIEKWAVIVRLESGADGVAVERNLRVAVDLSDRHVDVRRFAPPGGQFAQEFGVALYSCVQIRIGSHK